MQDDTSVENLRVLTDTARRYGEYHGGSASPTPPCDVPASVAERSRLKGLSGWPAAKVSPGTCFPWDEKVKELPEITGDRDMMRRVWEQVDGLGNMFIWQILLSF